MRHRKSNRRLGVPMHRRKAMLKQLAEALFLHGRIKTTVARAKELRRYAERMVTLAKKGSLHHRRQAMALVSRRDVVNRLFDHIVEWYKGRQGGYTRIIKLGARVGDGADMALIELVDWISGDKLDGQLVKQEKSETGEENAEAKEKEKKTKAKAKKKEEKKGEAKPEKKTKKSPEKEKRISERKADEEKRKKELSAQRAKQQKERADSKAKAKPAVAKRQGPRKIGQ